ncbi:MAG: leucine-rich repeat domain-containing protein [Clostridia bacterium]|nr:leucine-rich repeat domain-containing protein [Clostridia bacterium]
MKWNTLLVSILLAGLFLVGCTVKDSSLHGDNLPDKTECDHVAVAVPGTPPTCTEEGTEGRTVCSLCGESMETSEVLPATGHNYKNNICTACGLWGESVGLAFASNGDGTCTLVGRGTCTDDNICVPAISPEGEYVTHIGENVFQGHKIPGVYLSDGIEVIEKGAFSNMKRLTALRLPDTLLSIGEGAFRNCVELKSITIPVGVDTISENAFYDCVKLELAVLPDGLIEIGNYAFRNCYELVRADLPDSVRRIGVGAFEQCRALERMVIPEGVTVIEMTSFYYCMALKEVVLPESLQEIGFCAFDSCISLQHVDIPDGVQKLEVHAFNACSGLQSLVLPDDVTTLKSIGYFRSLERVHIPVGVTSIMYGVFDDCPTLRQVCYGGTQEQWQAVTIDRKNSSNQILLDIQMIYNCDGSCAP